MMFPQLVQYVPLIFFVSQALTTIISLEVSVRYLFWWNSLRGEDIPALRATILFIGIMTFGVTLNEGNWVYWRLFSQIGSINLSHLPVSAYEMSIMTHLVLQIGILGALFPLFRLNSNLSKFQTYLSMFIRFIFPTALYLLGVYSADIVNCASLSRCIGTSVPH